MSTKKKRRMGLTSWILLAIVLGVGCGAFLPEVVPYIGWMGELFKQSLKMLIAPLVLASMVCGMAALGDIRKLGALGLSAIGYYGVTTFLAIMVGMVLVNTIRPGVPRGLHPTDKGLVEAAAGPIAALDGAGRTPKGLGRLLVEASGALPSELSSDALEAELLRDLGRQLASRLGQAEADRSESGVAEALGSILGAARLKRRVQASGARGPGPPVERGTRPGPDLKKSLTIGQFLERQIYTIFVNPFRSLDTKTEVIVYSN